MVAKPRFQRRVFSAHDVGGILFNATQFPPLLLHTEIQPSIAQANTPLSHTNDLRAYRTTEMTLRLQTETTENTNSSD